jgi:signal transduction histidine kinase
MNSPRDRWSAKQPVTLNFPSDLLLPAGENQLRVRLRADYGRRAGLSEVLVGPMREVIPLSERQERWRVSLPQAASVFSLMVAFFCAVLWWQHRDPLYAWAGLGETLWAVVVADAVVETAPLPWPAWGFALVLLRALWLWTLYAVAEQIFGRRPRNERLLLLAVLAAIPLAIPAAIVLKSALPLRLVHFALGLAWLLVIARLAWLAKDKPSSDRVLFVIALAACLVAGVRDMVAARWVATLYDEPAWVKVMAPLIGVAVMWIVSVRFRRARAEVLELNASLADRVQRRETELRASFERLKESERARAVASERERILRDMHDGVGASLATAMRQLESGRAPPAGVVVMLRESLDQLKLSIDAMNLPDGDVNALLASLRYRLQPRIEGAGLALVWQVDALPPWSPPGDSAMRHLQFLLLEAISNALQHARAHTLTLSASARSGRIEITLADDGCGIDGTSTRGLRTMRERAAAIGAELAVDPIERGTRVSVRLQAGDRPHRAPTH